MLLAFTGCNKGLDSFEPFACAKDGTCPADYGCIAGGQCVSLSKHPVIPCGVATTCPLGMACDLLIGACASTCTRGCSADTTCTQAGVCRSGKPEGQGCTANDECVDRTCAAFAAGSSCVTPCTTKANCEDGARECVTTCANEACTSTVGICRLPCAACPPGWSCSGANGCQPGTPVGFACGRDLDCASHHCTGPAGFAICVDACSAAQPDCSTPTATCLPSGGFCLNACGANQACPAGGVCVYGKCYPGKPPGTACTANSECAGGSCLTGGYPGGVCTFEGCSSTNLCPQGSSCATVCESADCLDREDVCLASCVKDSDCRTGYGCLDSFGVKVCRPKGTGLEGHTCSAPSECASGYCVASSGGKICTVPCFDDLTCGPGKFCSTSLILSNTHVCGAACGSAACAGTTDVCACFADNFAPDGGGAHHGCQPKCTQDANCQAGSICVLATGLCERKSCQNGAQCTPGTFCSWNQTYDANCSTLGSAYASTCRRVFSGIAATLGARCESRYCADSICAGATSFAGRGLCSAACPDGTGCPSGTTCAAVDRPANPDNGTGALQSIKLCILPAASNLNGPCGVDAQCPAEQHCTRGFCDGRGALGSPCPQHDSQLECSLATTSWCVWQGAANSTCSIDCTSNDGCRDGGFPNGCCRSINSGAAHVCMTQVMCDGGS